MTFSRVLPGSRHSSGALSHVGTAAAGAGYRLPTRLDLFASAASQTGKDDHEENITAGVRLRF